MPDGQRERSVFLGLLPWPERMRVARALRTETVGGRGGAGVGEHPVERRLRGDSRGPCRACVVRAEAVGEALGQVVHRAAGDRAVGMRLTVLHAEGGLDELGGHAERAAAVRHPWWVVDKGWANLYFQVTDPRAAFYEIANFLQAVEQLTVTTLRNVVGSTPGPADPAPWIPPAKHPLRGGCPLPGPSHRSRSHRSTRFWGGRPATRRQSRARSPAR